MPTNVTTRTSLEDAQSIIDSIHQQAEAERQAAEQNKQPLQLPESMSKTPFTAASALGGNVSSPLDMLPQPAAAQTAGPYYSRPEQDTAAIKELQEFYNYSDIRTRSTQSEYETAVNRLNEIEEQLEQMSPLLSQLQQYYETSPSQMTEYLYTAKVNEYNSLADEYRELNGKLPGLYNSYAIHRGLLTDSVNAIEKFSNDQQAELDAWRSTIRSDQDAINAELEEARAQLKALASSAKAWGDPEAEKETDRQAQELLQKIKLLEEELDWSRYYGYEGLRDSSDFAELSRYASTANGRTRSAADRMLDSYDDADSGWDDPFYEYINGNEAAGAYIRSKAAAEGGGSADPLVALFNASTGSKSESQQMTDDEIAMYNYIYATQGKAAARKYYDYLESDLNYRRRKAEEEYWREYANEHKAAASAFSVVVSPTKAVTYVMQLADYLADGEIDQNASYNRPSYINSAIRGQIAETIEKSGKWGKVGSFAYQTGMSMADFLYTGLITGSLAGGGAAASGLALTIMSMSAAADATIEAKDKGLSDRQAFVLGAVAGAAEALTEKFSIEALLSGKWEDSLIKYILKNAFTEGMEEVGSDLINTLADILVSQDQSEWLQAVNGYMAEGKTQGEAFGLAARDQALAMGLDLLGGAASGGIMAGVGGSIGSIKLASDYKKTGGALRSMGIETVTNITDIALTLDENGKAHKLAQQVQTQLKKTGKVTDTQLGELFAATASELSKSENTAREVAGEYAQAGTMDTQTQLDPAVEAFLRDITPASKESTQTAQSAVKQAGGAENAGGGNIPANTSSAGPAVNTEDGLGAANAGFTTREFESETRNSRLVEGGPLQYDEGERATTLLQPGEYRRMLQYKTRSEGESMKLAREILYYNIDGKDTFVGEMPGGREIMQDIMSELEAAPAWSGVMVDTAMMLKDELQRMAYFEARNPSDETITTSYIDWLKVMREHATETGRGTQAWSKWERPDNATGSETESAAIDQINANTRLSKEEKTELINRVLTYDSMIDEAAAQSDGAKAKSDIIDIIVEIGTDRGTLTGAVANGRQSRLLSALTRHTLNGLTTSQLQQLAYNSSAAFARDVSPGASVGQKIKTLQILNMLSNPKTPARNTAGNMTFGTLDSLTMNGAVLLDMALSKQTGTRSVAAEKSMFSRAARSELMQAMRLSAAEVALDVDMGGEGKYSNSVRTFKANGNLVERIMSAIERNNAWLMTTTDEAAKGTVRGKTQSGIQSLMDAGKIKTDNVSYASERADALAAYRTFQGRSWTATAIQSVHDILNAIPILRVGNSGKAIGSMTVGEFGLGDVIAPFTKVAGNLLEVGIDYSPAKAIQGTVEIIKTVYDAHKGSIAGDTLVKAQAKAVSDTARGLMGSAIAAAVCALARAGFIRRADDEEDEEIAAMNAAEGMSGTQVNLSALMRGSGEWQRGDILIDFSSIEPLSYIFNLGCEMASRENLSPISILGSTKDSFLQTASDLPVVQTVGDLVQDVAVYKKDFGEALAEAAGRTAISSLTPNIMAGLAGGLDDYKRNAYTGDNLFETLLDYAKSRVPGLRSTLPAAIDITGSEKENPGGTFAQILNSMLNPIGVNTYTQSEVSKELESLRSITGDAAIYPDRKAPNSFTVGGEKYALTYEEKAAYQSAYSKAYNNYAEELISDSLYAKLPPELKAEQFEKIAQQADKIAQSAIIASRGGTETISDAEKARRALNAGDYVQYLIYAGAYNALNDDDGATASDISTMESLMKKADELPDGVQIILDNISGYSKFANSYEAGVSVQNYARLQADLDGITPPAGSKQAATWQKYEAIMSASYLSDDERDALLKQYSTTGTKNGETTYPLYEKFTAGLKRYDSDTLILFLKTKSECKNNKTDTLSAWKAAGHSGGDVLWDIFN